MTVLHETSDGLRRFPVHDERGPGPPPAAASRAMMQPFGQRRKVKAA